MFLHRCSHPAHNPCPMSASLSTATITSMANVHVHEVISIDIFLQWREWLLGYRIICMLEWAIVSIHASRRQCIWNTLFLNLTRKPLLRPICRITSPWLCHRGGCRRRWSRFGSRFRWLFPFRRLPCTLLCLLWGRPPFLFTLNRGTVWDLWFPLPFDLEAPSPELIAFVLEGGDLSET